MCFLDARPIEKADFLVLFVLRDVSQFLICCATRGGSKSHAGFGEDGRYFSLLVVNLDILRKEKKSIQC